MNRPAAAWMGSFGVCGPANAGARKDAAVAGAGTHGIAGPVCSSACHKTIAGSRVSGDPSRSLGKARVWRGVRRGDCGYPVALGAGWCVLSASDDAIDDAGDEHERGQARDDEPLEQTLRAGRDRGDGRGGGCGAWFYF